MIKIFKILLIILILKLISKLKNIEINNTNKTNDKIDNYIDNLNNNELDNKEIITYEYPLIGNILNRKLTSLNGKWNYIVDIQEVGLYNSKMIAKRYGYFCNSHQKSPIDLIEYDFDKAPEMDIPSDWNTKDKKLFFFEGNIWFKKSFNYTKKEGKRIFFYFGAVNYEAWVYINGRYLGRHEGGFTPFNFEITKIIKDGDNFIVVKIDNKRKPEYVPTIIFDWWNYGGITRDVYIVETDIFFIQNYKFYLDKNDKNAYNKIYYSIKLNINAIKKIGIIINELNIKLPVITDANGEVSGSINATNLILWSPENPKLYKIELKLGENILKDEIGFRIIETSKEKILLNGKPIFLYGVNIHEEKPNGGGRANTPEDAKKLLGWAKELGCNYVRLAHYPHNEFMIKEAEKMGIMVWSEIPVYWMIDFENENTYENSKNQLKENIERDINRANIIIWSIANETPQNEKRDKFLINLSIYARSLDNTRLISMAMNSLRNKKTNEFIAEDNMNKYVDIISLNEYMGWYRRAKDFSNITFIIPYEKPVIISEFGGGAKYGFHGEKNQRWTEEFQEYVYKENLPMFDKIKQLAGLTPWILKDFRSPRRVLSGIQDYYNRKGLVSDNGDKKKAFYVVKNFYENKKKRWK